MNIKIYRDNIVEQYILRNIDGSLLYSTDSLTKAREIRDILVEVGPETLIE